MPRAANGGISEGWHEARLIPAMGIRGQEEQEKRATASLLAVMRAVPEFGHALIGPLGAPKGAIRTYAEVQLKDTQGTVHIPDGAVLAQRGKASWTCLVEVKTGTASLRADQVNRYLDIARDNSFDAVLTISNEITASARDSPVDVDGRKLKRVALYHLSWWRVITEAIVQHRHRGVEDPDQAWILGELIAYLDDERSGAGGFQDMGENWVTVRSGAATGILRANDAAVRDVAAKWDQFVEYLALGLDQDLGREVRPVRPRQQSVAQRLDITAKQLAETGTLSASIKVPDAVGPITVEADLRARRITTSVLVDAPGDGKPLTRTNWLLRQLTQAPDGLILEVRFTNLKETTACALSEARETPKRLLSTSDPKRSPRSFRIALSKPMGTKRGKGERSFVRETKAQTVGFYRDLVQDLRPWRASPPKLPDEPVEIPEGPVPEPPRFSVVDEREVGEASVPPGLR